MNQWKRTDGLMALMQATYVPVEPMERATCGHSLASIQLAAQKAPGAVCGKARRIGSMGSSPEDLALLYRLKIRRKDTPSSTRGQVTLPGYFVLEQGIFTLCSIESSVHEMREEGGWHGHSSTLMHLLPGPEEESVGRVERHPQELAQPLGLALSTVSKHVRCLTEARVVTARRHKQRRLSRLIPSRPVQVLHLLLATLGAEYRTPAAGGDDTHLSGEACAARRPLSPFSLHQVAQAVVEKAPEKSVSGVRSRKNVRERDTTRMSI